MKEQAQENKSVQNKANANIQKKEKSGSANHSFEDNRSEAVVIRKLKDIASSEKPTDSQDEKNAIPEKSPDQTVANVDIPIKPEKPIANEKFSAPEKIIKEGNKDIAVSEVQEKAIEKSAEKNTGLPDNLKSGVEKLSGQSMDDVKVHYNSEKPSQLDAHAYAQGTDIHLGPGQEKHLPHEAWHVVQQKEGRVKPTKQLKGKVNINDDAGLEKEADVMGAKAASLPVQRVVNLNKGSKVNSNTAQLQTTEKDNLEEIKEYDSENAEKEKRIDPNSESHKKKLEEHRRSGKAMGESEQIKLQGELTFAAKFNRFMGKESTYSQLQRLATEFNNSKKVDEKQALLKELKPLARTWLEKHAISVAAGDKEDENEKLKRESVYGFLNQTTSNFSELSAEISAFGVSWKSNLSEVSELQESFSTFTKRYNDLVAAVEKYKNTYPPSVNLMYTEELPKLIELLKEVESGQKSGQNASYPNYGFDILNTTVNYSFSGNSLNFVGKIQVTISGFETKKGTIKAEPEDGKFNLIAIDTIEGIYAYNGVNIICKKFNLVKDQGLTSTDVTAKLNLFGASYDLKADSASITQDGFTFTELSANPDSFDFKEDKIQATTASLKMSQGEVLSVTGDLVLADRGITDASGKLNAKFNEHLELSELNFKRAKGTFNYGMHDYTLKGLGYQVDSKNVTLKFVERDLEFAGHKLKIAAKNGSISLDKELDARIFHGKLKGNVDTGKGIIVSNPAITYDKGASEGASKTTIQGGLSLNVGDNFSAKGKVRAVFDANGVKDIKVLNGIVNGNYEGIDLKMTGLQYLMSDSKMFAKKVNAEILAFDKKISLSFKNARIQNNAFDFDEITASLDGVDFGVLKVTNPSLTYNRKAGSFKAALQYELDKSKLPDALKDSELSAAGGLIVEWDPDNAEKRNYEIQKTDASLKMLGQTLSVTKAEYNSKSKKFSTETATLKMDLGFFKGKELKGKKVSFGADKSLEFSELSLAHKEDLDLGIVSLSSEKFLLEKDDKGYKVQTTGNAKLNLPDILQAESSLDIAGAIGVYLKDPIKPHLNITKGTGEISLPNPLAELSNFLGDGWSKARFDLGATIPVFPGISAIFGVYLQFLAQIPDKIKGSFKFENENVDLDLKLVNDLFVEGGVYGGVQAGNQLLVALAVLLRAAAKMGIKFTVGYAKKIKAKKDGEKPNKELKASDEGFYYSLSGELKAGAYLDLVATAFYFFQKTFTLELAEWTLGEFEFSDKKEELPKAGKGSEFKEKDLQKEVTPEAIRTAQADKLAAVKLLDQEQNKRFSQSEKDEILNKIKAAEVGRGTTLEAASQEKDKLKESGALDLGRESLFDNVAAMNMQFMDKYIDLTIEWEAVFANLQALGTIDAKDTSDSRVAEIKGTLLKLAKVITIPGSFKDHYVELTKAFKTNYSDKISPHKKLYQKYLDTKALVVTEIHKIKHDSLHSSLFGDESTIDSALRTWSVYGSTNFEEFAKVYNALYGEIITNAGKLKIGAKEERYELIAKALEEMNEEHQRNLERARQKEKTVGID